MSTFYKFSEVAFMFTLALIVGLAFAARMHTLVKQNAEDKSRTPTMSYSEDLFMATPMYGWPHQVDVLD